MTVATDDASAVHVDFDVEQGAPGPTIKVRCSDRTSVVPLGQLLSVLQSLTNKVVEAAVEREQTAGREISCKAGCAACCRQLVPISVSEARGLMRLIAGLNDAHRARVIARFNDAISQLRASLLWDRLEKYSTLSFDERLALGTEYFRLGIACPFLEDESCSIHPERPLICRQYLVTSPSKHCSNPAPENITRVVLGANVSDALKRIERRDPSQSQAVPLALAPFLNLGEDERRKTVPDWLSRLLAEIKNLRDEQVSGGKEHSAREIQ
jgi:Fe-S-cluster containining protein